MLQKRQDELQPTALEELRSESRALGAHLIGLVERPDAAAQISEALATKPCHDGDESTILWAGKGPRSAWGGLWVTGLGFAGSNGDGW